MYPQEVDRHFVSCPRDIAARSSSPTKSRPEVGRSMPEMRFSQVVFPDPDGPIRARNSPAGTSRSRFSSGVTSIRPLRYVRLSPQQRIKAESFLSFIWAMGWRYREWARLELLLQGRGQGQGQRDPREGAPPRPCDSRRVPPVRASTRVTRQPLR